MRRKDHPSFPSAMTCCFFSSLKTLLMPTEPIRASVGVNVPGLSMAGFQLTLHGRFWVIPEVTGVLLFAARPSLAHHSRAMFDMTKNITYRGVVEEYQWQNPHCHILIIVGSDAKDPSTVGTWD